MAVPAQPQAGVVKAMGVKHYETLKELLADYPRFAGEVDKLKAQAELGVRALKELREDVVRLAALADPQAEMKVLQSMVKHLEEPELRQLQRALWPEGGQELSPAAALCTKAPVPVPGGRGLSDLTQILHDLRRNKNESGFI